MQDKFTYFILLNATKHWLRLSRDERGSYFEKIITPISQRFADTLSFRFFDAEYFNANVSDVLMLETTNIQDYMLFIEYLRDTDIYTVPYFEIINIIPAKENAYKELEGMMK